MIGASKPLPITAPQRPLRRRYPPLEHHHCRPHLAPTEQAHALEFPVAHRQVLAVQRQPVPAVVGVLFVAGAGDDAAGGGDGTGAQAHGAEDGMSNLQIGLCMVSVIVIFAVVNYYWDHRRDQ